MVRVLGSCDSAAAEQHTVLREGSCLVGEQVLDLSKIFCDVQRSALHSCVQYWVIQIYIILNKIHLSQLHDLDRHIEGNRNQHLQHGNKKEHSNVRYSYIAYNQIILVYFTENLIHEP